MLKHKKPTIVDSQRGRSEIPKCCVHGFSPINGSRDVGRRRSVRLSLLSQSTKGSSPSKKLTNNSTLKTNADGKKLYPTYLPIPGINRNTPSQVELAKGSFCKMIVELWADGETMKETVQILKRHIKTTSEGIGVSSSFYTIDDVTAIRIACNQLGLGKENPLEAEFEDYENESVEGWWIESYWETESRKEPISKNVYGGKGGEWWTKREKAKHRDWSRFRSPEVGALKHKFTSTIFGDQDL